MVLVEAARVLDRVSHSLCNEDTSSRGVDALSVDGGSWLGGHKFSASSPALLDGAIIRALGCSSILDRAREVVIVYMITLSVIFIVLSVVVGHATVAPVQDLVSMAELGLEQPSSDHALGARREG